MEKIRFACDYGEGALPEIMERLARTNLLQTAGYGEDEFCESARKKIREACALPEAEVQFLVGGTQTNLTVISAVLRPYQGVVAADTGHISVHETGAIEACGHKVLAVPGTEGKLTAEQIETVCREHREDPNHEHMVQPGMVYLSFPTEYGTLYSKRELEEVSAACRRNGLPLYIDGARLACALASARNDVALEELAALCDVFYIGGTKCGALFGEAVVIRNPALSRDFRYLMKQKGGMLAKGRLLGIQFDTLMTENLYIRAAEHAVGQAMRIRRACEEKGWPLLVDSWTNQQFPILTEEKVRKLSERFVFETWERVDEGHTAVRFCTSWATRKEDVDALIAAL